jgi:hypothetical protein
LEIKCFLSKVIWQIYDRVIKNHLHDEFNFIFSVVLYFAVELTPP